ncbi:MAG: DUF1761 family protein [Bacillus sp. (in: Bacteria)]|nr:DUF1761 family protein [Bacillus sp. (in: firmicutes)]
MILAIITGFILYMVIGMAYYAIVGNRWLQWLNIKDAKQPNYGLLTAVTLLTTVLLYFVLQISQAITVLDGAIFGFVIGIIIALAYAKDFIFGLGTSQNAPRNVYFTAVGYHIIALTVIGAVMMLF